MSNEKKIKKVIVVGAGPSGLVLAILLAKAGIEVIILDGAPDLDKNPRAAHYAPSAVRELKRAGVLEEIQKQGFNPDSVCWRNPDGTLIAGIKTDVDHPEAMVVLPLDRLVRLLYNHFLTLPGAEVEWNHKVVGIEHGEQEAKVKVESLEGGKTFAADYVIGADGANSQIRRSLFGDLGFPGETLQSQIIATNVYYDFHKFGYWDSNFIIDPKNWFMAARITTDGLWRVTYGDTWGLSTEEYLKRQPQRFEEMLPGKPKPGDYKLVSASPYKLHQRCAESFRVGRFLLVADAAHLCNPFGGLGLTGGFADVTSLYDCLMAMQNGLADDSILDKYSEVRRKKWHELVDPISRANFRRIWDEDAIPERNEFFAMCKKMESDEEMQKQGQEFTHLLNEDFTPYFSKPLTT
ncbi:hypothetical protein IFR05_014481 [Cadophora sp. M221]|nr:hypothetical protein IFR05_014481 [Cadophora sp. M221]